MNTVHSVSALAPATVANVACGFDIFGFALEGPSDIVTARVSGTKGIRIDKVIGDGGRLPLDPSRNASGAAAHAILSCAGDPRGISLILRKHIPLASGLGGSAASSVAAAFAVNALLDLRLPKEMLLSCALEGERAASGSPHPDNAAASLFGGFTLVTRTEKSQTVTSLPIPSGFCCAILRPHMEIETGSARSALAESIRLEDAVLQWGFTAGLVAGLFTKNWDLIRKSLRDVVAEPIRSKAVPGFASVQQAALKAGALGCSLSGSGPSIFGLCRDRKTADRAREEMAKAFSSETDLGFDSFVSRVSPNGARLMRKGTGKCTS